MSEISSHHDPRGVDLAVSIAENLASGLPKPRPVRSQRRLKKTSGEQRSGAHPDGRDPQLLGSAFTDLATSHGWTNQLNVRQIVNRWSKLVGESNAEHCAPETFIDGVLVVRAESTTWASALRSIAPSIIKTINQQLGSVAVRRIEVKGPSAPSWKHGIRSVRNGLGARDTYG